MNSRSDRIGHQEAGERLYRLVESLRLDERARDSLIDAFKLVCAHAAGADGRVGPYEDGTMFQVFWQDVRLEEGFDRLRERTADCPMSVEAALRTIEARMTACARESAPGPSPEALVDTLAAVCACVLAADRPRAEELARLAGVERRLRLHAADLAGPCPGPDTPR